MTEKEQEVLAKNIFEPEQKVRELRYDARPDLIVVVKDDYGRCENRVTDGDWLDEPELRRSFESLKRRRVDDIGEWEYQKKLSAEIVEHLNGAPDPTNRMRWLPKLVHKRFLDDFRLHFPELEKLLNNSVTANTSAVIDELQSIPFSWQKSA
jgi:hypothetical protein